MSKISNILRMLQLLNNGKKLSINYLAQELEVSPRMIRKYKDELEMAGIYIVSIKGRYGGYLLENKVLTPAVKINQKDIEYLEKLPFEETREIADKLKLIVDEYDYNKIDISSSKFNTFQRAIKNKQKMEIVYDSLNLGKSSRIINPIEMFLFSNEWYVVAYCHLRHDMRNFEFKSIIDYKILKEKF